MARAVETQTRAFSILVSKVDMYARCPAQYFAVAVQRLPQAPLDGQGRDLPIRVGNAVHAVIASVMRIMVDGKSFPDISSAVDTFFDRAPLVSGAFAAHELRTVRSLVEEAVWNVRAFVERRSLIPLSVEHTLSIPRIPVMRRDDKGEDALYLAMSGRFDLIALQEHTNTLWVPDWKTGHALPGPELFVQLPSVVLTDFLLKHVYLPRHPEIGAPKIKLCHFLTGSGELVEAVLTTQQIEVGKALIRHLAYDLEDGQFAPRLNPFCPWCPARNSCPLYEGDASEELYDEF